MAVFQLGVFPVAIKIIGITTGQRVGFTLGALAFLAVPAGKSISWSFSSLYAVLVAATAVINCSMSAVSVEGNEFQCRLWLLFPIASPVRAEIVSHRENEAKERIVQKRAFSVVKHNREELSINFVGSAGICHGSGS